MNIILGLIPFSKPEPSLLHAKIPKNSALLSFHIDDIFRAFKTYQEQYIFLHDHFFPRMVWCKLKLAFSKLKTGMTKIFVLGEEYEIEGKIKVKSNKIKKILTWLVSQN